MVLHCRLSVGYHSINQSLLTLGLYGCSVPCSQSVFWARESGLTYPPVLEGVTGEMYVDLERPTTRVRSIRGQHTLFPGNQFRVLASRYLMAQVEVSTRHLRGQLTIGRSR